MSERSDLFLLEDIVQAIDRINTYTKGVSEDGFLSDTKTQDAVCRNFEIIGEATSRLSDNIKKNYSDIEWKKLKNFRNKIIHDYFGTDYRLVWSIIQNQLSELRSSIAKVIVSLNKE